MYASWAKPRLNKLIAPVIHICCNSELNIFTLSAEHAAYKTMCVFSVFNIWLSSETCSFDSGSDKRELMKAILF